MSWGKFMGNWSAISSFKEILYIFRTKYIVWSSVPFSTELKDYNELFDLVAQQGCNFLLSWKKGQFIESRSFLIYKSSKSNWSKLHRRWASIKNWQGIIIWLEATWLICNIQGRHGRQGSQGFVLGSLGWILRYL